MCVASWFLAPKGENQVYVLIPQLHPLCSAGILSIVLQKLTRPPERLWRSSLILAIVACYLMWAITFLAQLHPLIAPKRHDLRDQFLD